MQPLFGVLQSSGARHYQDNPERAVTDYISGMSDEFAIRTFEDVFVPRKWHVL